MLTVKGKAFGNVILTEEFFNFKLTDGHDYWGNIFVTLKKSDCGKYEVIKSLPSDITY